MRSDLGIYVSVPFCRAKCTYCNFASGVFAAEKMDAYVARLCGEIERSRADAVALLAELPETVDSVYLGGGTPSLLSGTQLRRIFDAIRGLYRVADDAEVTLECAPGQLEQETLDELLRQGMNRVSFGVQSFIDAEAKAVGRSHTRALCLEEMARLRRAGVANLNVDLIAGLPCQTAQSWRESVQVALESGAPHVSVYMLEVDEDSRLGREVLAAGSRFGAGVVPHEDDIAAWYADACEWLAAGGVLQYEISNFARPGFQSRHNERYWLRRPYLGFGLDAHSMLEAGEGSEVSALRFANTDDLERYIGASAGGSLPMLRQAERDLRTIDRIGRREAFEETLFLGLRRNAGVDLGWLRMAYGDLWVDEVLAGVEDAIDAGLAAVDAGLAAVDEGRLRLTPEGRMVSNEVFGRLLLAPAV